MLLATDAWPSRNIPVGLATSAELFVGRRRHWQPSCLLTPREIRDICVIRGQVIESNTLGCAAWRSDGMVCDQPWFTTTLLGTSW
jgi:hypothetical protein